MGQFEYKHEDSIKGRLLVSTPALHSSCFERSVIYMCGHDIEGAMGIIVNHTLNDLDFLSVLKRFNIDEESEIGGNLPIHFGGPVDMLRGFILHSPEYQNKDTHVIDELTAITSNVDILKDINAGKGPKDRLLALGYAGWESEQLEGEIESGSWFTVPSTYELVFGIDNNDKWANAISSMGIEDPYMFSGDVGHA